MRSLDRLRVLVLIWSTLLVMTVVALVTESQLSSLETALIFALALVALVSTQLLANGNPPLVPPFDR